MAEPTVSDWVVERLGPRHDRASFDCGQPTLNDWLKLRAGQFDKKDLARTYVASRRGEAEVQGDYAIATHRVGYEALADDLPEDLWGRLGRGAGSKGQRPYDWAFVSFPFQSGDEFVKGLLVRRSIADPSERAYYLRRFRRGSSPEELVRVAGCRWAIEVAFEQARQEVGLDDYEVRGWDGWHRHVTLALFAHAFLEAARAAEAASPPPKRAGPRR